MREAKAAYWAVTRAVQTGLLPPATSMPCAGCGRPARGYHHPRGYDADHRLEVVALCGRCHRQRHPTRPGHGVNRRLTVEVYDGDEDLVRRARIAALRNDETMRELVIRAVRQEVERLEAGQRRKAGLRGVVEEARPVPDLQ